MKVTFDGSYGIPSSVSHPAAARHRKWSVMKVTFDGSYGMPSSVSHPAAARHSLRRIRSGDCRRRRDLELVGGSEPQPPDLAVCDGSQFRPPSQVKDTCNGFYLQSVKGYIYH
uniref:Uncharacterized protein n=1 Tax=Oryza glumipatula TaxID=40148 RepID=A0A0D9ZKU3_9ORYZ